MAETILDDARTGFARPSKAALERMRVKQARWKRAQALRDHWTKEQLSDEEQRLAEEVKAWLRKKAGRA